MRTRIALVAGGLLAGTFGGAPADAAAGLRAASYLNGDAGRNADVDPASSCVTPDRKDSQPLSDPATGNPGNSNVHNDACALDRSGGTVDVPGSFQSSGVGYISACPDPDGAGPKFARLSDTDGDGRNDLCFQSGYQDRGIAGDDEFHARLNNTTTPGVQHVVWCADADGDGCRGESVRDSVKITWTARQSAASTFTPASARTPDKRLCATDA